MKFTKPPTTFQEQLDQIIERGMLVDDHEMALHYLSHVNYYRLSGYWFRFEESRDPHRFKKGTRFETILDLYLFDKKLRLLILNAIERIEVSVRTQFAYHLSLTYGSHAHLDASIFTDDNDVWNHRWNLNKLKGQVKKSHESFVSHFEKYEEELPPIWVVCEIMTFGQFSTWFSNLKARKDRNAIAHIYDMDSVNLDSFLHHLSTLRNLCAHHSRVWNRVFTINFTLPKGRPHSIPSNLNLKSPKSIYNTLVMLAYFMDMISPGHKWKTRLFSLIKKHTIDVLTMGFPEDYAQRPIWKIEGANS